MDKKTIGTHGESLAKAYLQAKGYEILASNIRTRFAEIDILAQYNHTLHFIEVKTRTGNIFDGKESITHTKLQRMFSSAQFFLATQFQTRNFFWEIDLMCIKITPTGETIKIDHIKNLTAI